MGRRRFNLGRIVGQVIGWICFLVPALTDIASWIHHL